MPEVLLSELYTLSKRKKLPLGECARELITAGLRTEDLNQLAGRLTALEDLLTDRVQGIEKLLAAALWKVLETAEWTCDGRPPDQVQRVRDETGRRVTKHVTDLLGRNILD